MSTVLDPGQGACERDLKRAIDERDRDGVVAAYAALIPYYERVDWLAVNGSVARRYSLREIKKDAWRRFLYGD